MRKRSEVLQSLTNWNLGASKLEVIILRNLLKINNIYRQPIPKPKKCAHQFHSSHCEARSLRIRNESVFLQKNWSHLFHFLFFNFNLFTSRIPRLFGCYEIIFVIIKNFFLELDHFFENILKILRNQQILTLDIIWQYIAINNLIFL